MKCKKCGFEMADNAKFCPQCGAKVDEEATLSVNTQDNNENDKNDAEEVVTENDKEQENISNKTGSKFSDNKKKILIIASIAVVIIIIAVISSKSGSSDNSYTGNADTDSGYNDIDENYDNDFGNDDVVTEPETTEAATANQDNNYEINYPDGTICYSYFSEVGMKITDVKTSTETDGTVHLQIEVEKVSQNLTDDLDRRKREDGLWFWLVLNIYDKNGMIIETEDMTLSHLSYDDPIGTKYMMTETLYTFDRDNIDIAKIDIVERN